MSPARVMVDMAKAIRDERMVFMVWILQTGLIVVVARGFSNSNFRKEGAFGARSAWCRLVTSHIKVHTTPNC